MAHNNRTETNLQTNFQTSFQTNSQENCNESHSPVIAIVGAGLSGTLVVVNLLKKSTNPLTIKLIERREQLAMGIAYSTDAHCHLLNVSADNMTAFSHDMGHFLRWLYYNYSELANLLPLDVTASTFIPRKVYGIYLQSILEEAIATASTSITLDQIHDEAIALERIPPTSARTAEQSRIFFRHQESIVVDKVVLALGNSPQTLPENVNHVDPNNQIRNAWSSDALEDLDPSNDILLMGTGLTMVDMAQLLHERQHKGKIYAISRRGLLPRQHQITKPYPAFLTAHHAPKTIVGLCRCLRREVQKAQVAGYDWRSVIDSLRPITQELWQQLPLEEQKRFLRHAVPYWDVHRHRIAPQVAKVIDQLLASGQLTIVAGRVQNQQQNEHGITVTIKPRLSKSFVSCFTYSSHSSSISSSTLDPKLNTRLNTTLDAKLDTLVVQRIVNCTGFATDYRKLSHPLVESLRSQKLIYPNPIGLGIASSENGAVLDDDHQPSTLLYTMGTLRKGDIWETIAVPELREQAQSLAETLLRSLHFPVCPISITPISIPPTLPLVIDDVLRPVNSTLIFRQFFDPETSSYTYLISDCTTREAVLVDPVLEQVERDLQAIDELGLILRYCLETHIHADHITGAGTLRQLRGAEVLVPENAAILNADLFLADGEILMIGSVTIKAISTNGHTNAHLSYLVNNTHLLTGDSLFIHSCGRTDLQGGDAGTLYDVVTEKLLILPDQTLVYPAHDYKGRTVSTIGEEKRLNPKFSGRTREQFITMMSHLNLKFPKKMNESVPANQYCGDFSRQPV